MKARRIEERFLKNNRKWLNSTISFQVRKSTNRGRPTTSFETSAERTKRQKTTELRSSTCVAQLTYAIQMSLRAAGQIEASKVVQDITTIPTRASKYRRKYEISLK